VWKSWLSHNATEIEFVFELQQFKYVDEDKSPLSLHVVFIMMWNDSRLDNELDCTGFVQDNVRTEKAMARNYRN
jgi:hypothetical protein